MKTDRRSAFTLATLLLAAALLGGCASAPTPDGGTEPIPPFRDPALTLQQASEVALPGLDKAEVARRLGPAAVVRFTSGYEVWAYRLPARTRGDTRASERNADRPEFIVLFSPAGVVAKTRMREVSTTAQAYD